MKKKRKFLTKKSILISSGLTIGALTSLVSLNSSNNTLIKQNQVNNKISTFNESESISNENINKILSIKERDKLAEIEERKFIDSLSEDSTSDFITHNGIRIFKPVIGGPTDLTLKKQDPLSKEVFNPLSYGFYVYDGLDPDVNDSLVISGDKVDLKTPNTYNITISAINKYKLKTSKSFKVKVVEEVDYNQKVTFKYNPYSIQADHGLMWDTKSIYNINTDWQLLVPVVVKRGQRIKIEKISPNPSQKGWNDSGVNHLNNLSFIKLPVSSQEAIDSNLKDLNQGLPIFEYVKDKRYPNVGEQIPQENMRQRLTFDKKGGDDNYTETYIEEPSVFNYDAVYLIKTKIENYFIDPEEYKITIIDGNGQNISNLDEGNKQVSILIDTNSEGLTKEEEFLKQWEKNQSVSVIKNKAIQWVLTKEDLEKVLYRGAKEENGDWKLEKVKPEWIKESNKLANKMIKDYKKIAGIYNDVSHGKENLHFSASTLAFSFKIGVPADAVARNDIGIWQNNDKFSINYKPNGNQGENWLQGMWINNRDNLSKLPEFLKHEFGHIFQSGKLGSGQFQEVSNIFYYLYTDFQDKLEEKIEDYKTKNSINELSEKEIKKLELEVWSDFRYFATFPKTLENPILKVYNDVAVKNPKFVKELFNSQKVNNYNDIKHTIFPKIFAKYGWGALTYVWEQFRKIQTGERIVIGLNYDDNPWDYYVYFLGEYTKKDFTFFFETYGVDISTRVKKIIVFQKWIPINSLNLLTNNKSIIQKVIKENDDVFSEDSLVEEKVINESDFSKSSKINIHFKKDFLKTIKNQRVILIGYDVNGNSKVLQTKTITNDQLYFDMLNKGFYKVMLDWGNGDILNFNLLKGETKDLFLNPNKGFRSHWERLEHFLSNIKYFSPEKIKKINNENFIKIYNIFKYGDFFDFKKFPYSSIFLLDYISFYKLSEENKVFFKEIAEPFFPQYSGNFIFPTSNYYEFLTDKKDVTIKVNPNDDIQKTTQDIFGLFDDLKVQWPAGGAGGSYLVPEVLSFIKYSNIPFDFTIISVGEEGYKIRMFKGIKPGTYKMILMDPNGLEKNVTVIVEDENENNN